MKKKAGGKGGAKGGKKGAKEEVVAEVVVDEPIARPESTIKQEVFDPTNPESFLRGLKYKAPRPFLFGPVDFDSLDINDEENPWDREEQCRKVEANLESSTPSLKGFC